MDTGAVSNFRLPTTIIHLFVHSFARSVSQRAGTVSQLHVLRVEKKWILTCFERFPSRMKMMTWFMYDKVFVHVVSHNTMYILTQALPRDTNVDHHVIFILLLQVATSELCFHFGFEICGIKCYVRKSPFYSSRVYSPTCLVF